MVQGLEHPHPPSLQLLKNTPAPPKNVLAKLVVSVFLSLALPSNVYPTAHVCLQGIAVTVMFENHCSGLKYNITGAGISFSADPSRPRHVLFE